MATRFARLAALAAVCLLAAAQPTLAAQTRHLSGGGTAAISQVAMNVAISGSGSASGSFECLMAGRSAFVLSGFGLSHIMAVHATPTAGSVTGSIVTFSGPARVILDGRKADIHVSVWADVATQTFQLTVLGLAPQPITMPIETLLSGQIALS